MKTLNFGKHNGKTLEQVAAIDPSYIEWLVCANIEHWSELAVDYVVIPEDDEDTVEICPICHNTSCNGPSEHSNRPYGGRR